MAYYSRKSLEYLGEPIGSPNDSVQGKFRKYYGGGGGKGKSPKAPDYAALAAAQGQANLDAARASAKLNNPNIINPYGTQTVTYDGKDQDVGTVTQTLSPAEQLIYDKDVTSRTNLGDLSIQGSESLKDIIGQQIDLSGAPAVGDGAATREKVYNALMGRVNEDTANSRDDANSKLIAAGIRPGTKAYDDAQNLISRQYNDARGSAEVQAGNAANQQFGMDTQNRQQYISELLAQRQTPLNEINALMSGAQVNNPFAGGLGYQAGNNVQAAPIFAGAQAQGQADINKFNAQQSGSNSMMGGLFSLGAAGIQSRIFSDRRLKRNIVKIGTYINGLAKYSFEYIWGEKSIGAMADEVEKLMPQAVMTHASGYKMVDYAMVGE
jgi:hypothetical protein